MDTPLIDVCGLVCPEPVMAFINAAKKDGIGKMEVRFDCAAARDNIARAAGTLGWRVVSVEENPDCTRMVLEKKP